MKKLIALVLSFSIFGVNAAAQTNMNYVQDGQITAASASQSPEDSFSETVDIIHTTDIHGNAEASGSYIGYGKIAGYIDSVREENENTLVLDSGDTYEGLPYSNITKGESIVPVLKAIGYDAMTLGNHEFSYNTEIRNSLLEAAGIPVVSANITDDDGNLLYDEYIIKKIGDIKIGIFGLTTEGTKTSVLSENVENIRFQNAEESARRAVCDLEAQGCDYIIALTHLGSADTEGNASIKIAENVDGIDLMLDGHSHVINEGTMYGDTLLVASGYYGNAIGRVTIGFDNDEAVAVQVKIVTADELTDIESNSEVDSIVAEYTEKANEFFDKVIATTDILWIGDAATTRTQPTLLGTFIAESYRAEADADIGIVNGGGVRQSVNAGQVTNKDIYAVQPFANTISGYYVKGGDIIATFKESLEQWGTGEFLQFSGIKAEYDSSTNEIISISFSDGSPIEADKQYKIATSSYVAGNSDFPELSANAEYITDYGIDYEITLKYIEKYGMTPVPVLIKDISADSGSQTTEASTEAVTEAVTEASSEAAVKTSAAASSSGGVGSSSLKAAAEQASEETEEKIEENAYSSETVSEKYQNPFDDVNDNDWFYDSVEAVNKSGLFKGINENEFAPYKPLTRGMVVAVLYRGEGSPVYIGESSFIDVDDNAYYKNAVVWAENNGIVNGVSESEFAPDDIVTREQIAAILNRYADYKNYDTDIEGDLSEFYDSDEISQWAEDNMKWAVGSGIFSGYENNILNPHGFITRAEAASVIYRFYGM